MRVAIEDIAKRVIQTASDLPKLILINGNEPLLVEEALDSVRQALKECGVSERLRYQVGVGFDWREVNTASQTMSLFAERRLIEVRVPGKLGVAGTKALTEYCANLSSDDVLLLIMPYLDKRQRQAKWFQALDKVAWVADSYEISAQQFPQWLRKRLQSRALRVEKGVVELMVQQLEGNVLAAAQEIDKLQVLAPDGAVTLELLQRCMADHARFDVYALVDACLLGDVGKSLRILGRLQTEGVEPVIIVWALVREIRSMASMAQAIAAGQSKAQVFKANRVWAKRETLVNQALQRMNVTAWNELLYQAACLDQSAKGQRFVDVGTVWFQIEQLLVIFCGVDVLDKINRQYVNH